MNSRQLEVKENLWLKKKKNWKWQTDLNLRYLAIKEKGEKHNSCQQGKHDQIKMDIKEPDILTSL